MVLRLILILCLTAAGSLRSEICEKPKVFIDCANCDMDFIRTEITFVNYVIERQAADVFIMITSQGTGGGGEKYTIEFTGKGRFENIKDTLKFDTSNDDTSDLIRNKVVRSLKMGLIRYISGTPLSDRISISYLEENEKEELKDEWDSWVFSIGGSGYLNGNAGYDERNLHGYINVRRITEEWIIRSTYFFSHNYSDNRRAGSRSTSESQNSDITVVKSLTDHWSAGIVSGWNTSEYSNRKNYFYLYPRVEYNIFPYSESNTRMLRIMYGIGANYTEYYQTTIYEKDKELRYKQSLEAALSVNKEWGNVNGSVTGSSFLHDLEKKRFDSYAQISLRIVKGLSLNLSGGYSIIHDQISLPKGDYTDEEILFQKKEMATTYSYWSSIGFSYTFGSIYNNVVNPRFGN
jgi:hypothetical protein